MNHLDTIQPRGLDAQEGIKDIKYRVASGWGMPKVKSSNS